ncbi:MAG TPA: ester cyclase [Thermoleophilaceae bacterium]|jgi:predicted ester cyclase
MTSGGTRLDGAEKTRTYYEELWNRRNLDVIADWIAPDFVGHYSALPEPVHGPDGFRGLAEDLFAAFPDLTMTVVETVEQDHRVASRVEMRGTHLGELQGFAPTGLPVAGTLPRDRALRGRPGGGGVGERR